MNELTIPIHHKIYTLRGKQIIEHERKNSKEFQNIYRILDELMQDTKAADEKIMGFLRGDS